MFCKGQGLFTFSWTPNFKPNDALGQFMPFWICLPTLPLEYRDPNIIEIIANQIGIYIKHDLIPYENLQRDVRVCLLLNMSKPKPTGITIKSKWGVLTQLIVVQSAEIVDKYSAVLGHFTSDCLQDQIPNVEICRDHSTDPFKCAWANAKLFQAYSQKQVASNQVLLSEAIVPFQKDFVPTNDFIFIIQVLVLLYFFWHYWRNNRAMDMSSKSALLLMGSDDSELDEVPDLLLDMIVHDLTYHNNPINFSRIINDLNGKKIPEHQLLKVAAALSTTFASDLIHEIAIEEGVSTMEIIHPDDIIPNYPNGTQLVNVENPLNEVQEGTIVSLYPKSFDNCQMNAIIQTKLLASTNPEVAHNLNDINKMELPSDYCLINEFEESQMRMGNQSVEGHILNESKDADVMNPTSQESESSQQNGNNIDKGYFDFSIHLSLDQSPTTITAVKKIPKKRGRKPKSAKTILEVDAGIQSTLDDKFSSVKRLTRRTRGSPCQQ